MTYFMFSQTKSTGVSISSTSLFADSKPSGEWLASIKTVTQTELFQEVAEMLENIYDAIILAGYTPNYLRQLPKVCDICGSSEEVKSLCSTCR